MPPSLGTRKGQRLLAAGSGLGVVYFMSFGVPHGLSQNLTAGGQLTNRTQVLGNLWKSGHRFRVVALESHVKHAMAFAASCIAAGVSPASKLARALRCPRAMEA